MKTAREFFETHRDLHERFRTNKIGVRAFERAVSKNLDEINAADPAIKQEVGDLIKADIRRAMAEARARLATEGFTWRTADGHEHTVRVRGQAWEVTTR